MRKRPELKEAAGVCSDPSIMLPLFSITLSFPGETWPDPGQSLLGPDTTSLSTAQHKELKLTVFWGSTMTCTRPKGLERLGMYVVRAWQLCVCPGDVSVYGSVCCVWTAEAREAPGGSCPWEGLRQRITEPIRLEKTSEVIISNYPRVCAGGRGLER